MYITIAICQIWTDTCFWSMRDLGANSRCLLTIINCQTTINMFLLNNYALWLKGLKYNVINIHSGGLILVLLRTHHVVWKKDTLWNLICDFNRVITCQNFTILASMFVWRFVTCQNFQFWQLCSSDGLFVGLCVSLSVSSSIQVTVFDISLPNLTPVCIYVT